MPPFSPLHRSELTHGIFVTKKDQHTKKSLLERKVGYEINFNRVFFRYQPPRPLDEIDAALEQVEKRILTLLKEVTA